MVRQDDYPVVVKGRPSEKFGIVADPNHLTNVHIKRAEKLVQKLVVRSIRCLKERIRWPFAIVHNYLWVEYFRKGPDTVAFPLTEGDYIPDEELQLFVDQSVELDSDYYALDEEPFEPPANIFLK